jgi:hypothetical protein
MRWIEQGLVGEGDTLISYEQVSIIDCTVRLPEELKIEAQKQYHSVN